MRLLLIALLLSSFAASASVSGKIEYGLAEVYSNAFEGSKTSSNALYDPSLLTAAHKSLPFGSTIKVTNMENGKHVIAQVNDRGPMKKGYIVILSGRAAQKIDLRGEKPKVKLEVVSEAANIRESELEASDLTADELPESYGDDTNNPFSEVETNKDEAETVSATTKEKAAAAKPKPKDASSPVAKADKVVEKGGAEEAAKKAVAAEGSEKPEALRRAAAAKGPYKVFDLYKTVTLKPEGVGYGYQVGVYDKIHNVLKETARLQEQWFSNTLLLREMRKEGPRYTLIVGHFKNRASAVAYAKDAKKKGLEGYTVAIQPGGDKEVYKFETIRPAKKGYAVQVMSLTDADNVMYELKKLKKQWFDEVFVHVAKGPKGEAQYKIMLGGHPSREQANTYKRNLAKKGISGFVVDLSKIK